MEHAYIINVSLPTRLHNMQPHCVKCLDYTHTN